jgi:DNA helicase-2/ATP-dependent DNA helicase PcrA
MYYKELYTRRTGGSLPQLVCTQDENLQSRYVVQKILELREQGVPLEEIAVLFRSSFLSFDLEIELTKANIPFVKFGGFKFVETSHVKDVVAYLRVLENPRDVVSWNRILLLIDGVGPRTAEKIVDDIMKRRVSLATDGRETLPTTKFWMQFNDYTENVQKLFDVLKQASLPTLGPAEKTFQVLQYYEPILRARYDDHQKRKKDLEMFQAITERYREVDTLLTDLALEPPNESIVDVASPGPEEEFLTLSTIHSAKGLEWNTVFVIYALEGRFPTMRSVSSNEELEEERRLMYVACTRAKANLFITYPMNVYDRESGLILTKPSRFIEGFSEHLLEPWVVE